MNARPLNRQKSSRQRPRQMRRRMHGLRWQRLVVGAGALLLVLGTLLVGLTGEAALDVRAATSVPTLYWATAMIPSGAPRGLPEGPVGMLATVDGAHFIAGQRVRLALVAGDTT